MNIPDDPSKTIRQLLNLAGPIQKLFDTFSGPLEGNLLEISGGSNSGKSRVALAILDEFNRQGKKLCFLDIENSGFFNSKQYPALTKPILNVATPINQDELLDSLKTAIEIKAQIIIIDYINLIADLDYDFAMKHLKKTATENNMFIMVVTHDRSKRIALHPAVEQTCEFKIEVSRSIDFQQINMKVVKNITKEADGPIISIPAF